MRYILVREHGIFYATPLNFTYLWSFGSLIGLLLALQILSGILLAMYYTAHVADAFVSIEHLTRDVDFGWFLRYWHSNGASFIFIFLFLHIIKGLYFTSFFYPYGNLWRTGMILFLLMMATAFLGYVLPWGQMSYWGATVITNLFTAIPKLGYYIVQILWGGYSVDNPTLNRFFSLHFILPIVIIVFIFIHLNLLHIIGSSHAPKIEDNIDKIPFYIYFYLKDLFSFLIMLIIFSIFIFFFPDFLGHSDNYIEADSLSTPTHIVPEWYFLSFHAILRSIPNKLGGVAAMFAAIFIMFLLPTIFLYMRKIYFFTSMWVLNPAYRPFWNFFFWIFSCIFYLLGWIGQKVVEEPYIFVGFSTMSLYFLFLSVFLPLIFYFELFITLKINVPHKRFIRLIRIFRMSENNYVKISKIRFF
jgi:quinol-cytochrome oxidoreductase complex cytochrome b subunit